MRKGMKKFTSTFLAAIMVIAGANVPVGNAKASDVEETVAEGQEEVVDNVGATVSYNYAKLLQYSLYFYDANMCGDEVGETSLLDWRDNCHTYDTTTYTRSDGSTVNVDLTGGFHDAGDHVKFGLPEAYAAFVLGMSYNTNKSAYETAKQTGHLKNITTHFAEYFVDCTVLNADGSSVEAFCCQVGQGGSGYDHGYWGAPEDQPKSNREVYFSSSSAPCTDIVCLSAAALTMQYINFGGDEYLNTAKKLFAYAQNNNKAVGTFSSTFYVSSNWEDDYCLAALMLYKATNDSQYLDAYNNVYANNNYGPVQKPYWPLGWDNVGPAVAYYANNSTNLNTLMNIGAEATLDGVYFCLSEWGSARYNTSLQYTGLLYDKMTSTTTYRAWSENQMKYLLGNNSKNVCFVTGYNDYSAKYPHHRAASGYTGGDKGTTAQAYTLIGALVGGPKPNGSYTDSASDYVCNEVAIDYNATLVAAAAALYDIYTSDTTNHYIDIAYYSDDTSSSGGESGGNAGGESGGNAGGESGGESGGNAGGESGGESGGNAGGESGGESGGTTGGESGGNTSTAGNWVSENGNWYYVDESGKPATGWQQVSGSWYYMDNTGAMTTGWQQVGGSWYYMDSTGAMETGWQEVNGSWYYFNEDGSMAQSTWVGSYYVGASGAWETGASNSSAAYTEGWKLSGGLWWYQNSDGSYPASTWKLIGNAWYYFDSLGWMETGWVHDGNGWYYMNPSGDMATGWVNDSGSWYYLTGSGLMATGWVNDSGIWYYMNTSGAMHTGWLNDNGTWYYLCGSGAMAVNTVIDGYTIDGNGAWVQ